MVKRITGEKNQFSEREWKNGPKPASRPDDYMHIGFEKSDLKKRALQSASLSATGQMVSFALHTGGTVILARILSPSDFGLVTMVLAISLLLQNFGFNGFTEAIIQREEINHSQISTLFWINLGISLALAVLFAASAPVVVWLYKEPRLNAIVVAIAASIALGGLSTQHQALLMRKMEFKKIATNEVVATFISFAVSIILAYFGWGYWALVAKWIVSPLSIAAGAWLFCTWRPGFPVRGSGVTPMVRFAFHTYGNFITSYLRRNIDKILIGRFYGSQPLGYYDRAYHLSNMVPDQILNPLTKVALATFSRLSKDREGYCHSYLNVVSILAFVSMPLSAIMTLAGRDLIVLLLGPQWSRAGEIFCVFGPSIGVAIIYLTHGWLHLSLGTPDRWFRWGIIAFIVTSLSFIIGILFGELEVAVAYSISFYVLIGPALWYAGRPINLKLFSVLLAIWKYYVAALVAGILCWFILYKFDLTSNIFIGLNIFIRVIISLFLCILIYLPLVVVFYRSVKPISQFISILREMIPKISSGK